MSGNDDGAFSDAEAAHYNDAGYVVRESVFDGAELAEVTAACEALVERLTRGRRGRRRRFGSYTFDLDLENGTVIKWEGDSAVVHGLEPFVHLSARLERHAADHRFLAPMRSILQCDAPALFTEKLNLKRPREGGANPFHQDYPYWVGVAANAAEVATAMLFLDDASESNGCLHVVPGSHKRGEWPRPESADPFAGNEFDASLFDGADVTALEVPAGSVVFFGPMLVHMSAPNTSEHERRALLYSYQPPGRPTQLDVLWRTYGSG
ncbi:MAG: phytanoyl-CoA dioxygenase family protein [Pseudomonadales bacterium]